MPDNWDKGKKKVISGQHRNTIFVNFADSWVHFLHILIFIACLQFYVPEKTFSSDDPLVVRLTSAQTFVDSTSASNSERDIDIPKSSFRFNPHDRSKPMHPYFHDGYRVLQDMRRLVQMFDYRSVTGYESMSDLIEISRHLPESKQAAMIGMAMAGGVANLVSEATNKQLRKMKIEFVQWKLEKIVLRNRFRYFNLNIQSGMNANGFGIYLPVIRTQYYRSITPYYSSEGFIFFSKRKLGFDCSKENGNLILTPFIYSAAGNIMFSYNHDRKIIRSRIDMRKASSFVIRIVHIKQLTQECANYILGEVLLCW